MMKYFWIGLGSLSVALGVIGIFLPVLPTTPFLLLAAWSFSQGSKRLHQWIMSHPTLSPPIKDWQTHRSIKRRVKILASISMLAVFALTLSMSVPGWAVTAQALILTAVSVFIWSRPEIPADEICAEQTDES